MKISGAFRMTTLALCLLIHFGVTAMTGWWLYLHHTYYSNGSLSATEVYSVPLNNHGSIHYVTVIQNREMEDLEHRISFGFPIAMLALLIFMFTVGGRKKIGDPKGKTG